jgi:hypothetical protein
MVPAGPTPEPADGFLFGICTHTERWGVEDQRKEVLASALCGAKVIRVGPGWGTVQPRADAWNWEPMDEIVRIYGEQGMEVQVLLAYTAPWAAAPLTESWTDPGRRAPRVDAWSRYVRAMAERYADRVRYWEVWNEPDIGFWQGTLDEYLEILEAAWHEIKAVDPGLQVMSGGMASYDRNPSFVEGMVARGAGFLDILAWHRHGTFELFRSEVEGPLGGLRAKLDPPKPLYFNETGLASVGGTDTRQAEALVRKLTFAWANGAMGYTWYDLRNDGFDPNDHEHTYGMMTHDFHPKAVYPAYNTLARLLHGKRYVGALDLPGETYAYVFADDAAHEQVICAWDQGADTSSQAWILDAPCESLELVDMMDNRNPGSGLDGDRAVLRLASRPAFLRLQGVPEPERLPRPVAPLLRSVAELVALPGRANHVPVDLHNPGGEEDRVHLSWAVSRGNGREEPAQTQTWTVGGDRSITVRLPLVVRDQVPASGGVVRIRCEWEGTGVADTISIALRAALIIPVETGAEGTPSALFVLDRREQVTDLLEADPAMQHRLWRGPEDLSARGGLLADEPDRLLFWLDVSDDVHAQPYSPEEMWNGDSVQLAFSVPGQPGFWELGLAVSDAGQPQVHCWHRPNGFQDPCAPLSPDVRRNETERTTSYRLALPFSAFGFTKEMLVRGMRFSFLVNDNDGEGRDGWIALSPGIGRSKTPSEYPLVVVEQ